MKRTSVVQGLKSLLHHQLPLSSKESQRLLNALTSSFRQQLDAAHPQTTDGAAAKPKAGDATSKTGPHGSSSHSAAFADKHLASVLTNPLLALHDGSRQPVLDLTSAKNELQKNPAKDPITLLEEYHEKGAATIAIASFCLSTFKQTIDKLPKEQRADAITNTQAGKRTLLWLWKSKSYETVAFTQHMSLPSAVVWFLLKEGSEDYLWAWLSADMKFGMHQKSVDIALVGMSEPSSSRWKSRILSDTVRFKIDESEGMSADSAIAAFLKAVAMKQASSQIDYNSSDWPLGPTLRRLVNILYTKPGRWVNTDPILFNKLIESVELPEPGLFTHHLRAQLHLVHPQSPSPTAAVAFLKAIAASEYPVDDIKRFTDPIGERAVHKTYWIMVRTAVQLQDLGRIADSRWVESFIKELRPDLFQHLPQDMARLRHSTAAPSEAEETHQSNRLHEMLGVTSPSFG